MIGRSGDLKNPEPTESIARSPDHEITKSLVIMRRVALMLSFVLACGGFESNLAWLREAWGPPADNFIVRGTPYNDGQVLSAMRYQFGGHVEKK